MQAQAVLTEGLGEDFLREFLEAEGVVVAVEKEKQADEKEEGGGCYDEWNAFFHERSSLLWGFYICMCPPQVSCVEGDGDFACRMVRGRGGVCGSSSGLRWGYFRLQFQKWGVSNFPQMPGLCQRG